MEFRNKHELLLTQLKPLSGKPLDPAGAITRIDNLLNMILVLVEC
jgi:hypothetical protein